MNTRVEPLCVAQGGVTAFRDPVRQSVQVGVDFAARGFGPGCNAGRGGAADCLGVVKANAVNRARDLFLPAARLGCVPGSRSIADFSFNLPAR